MSTDRSAAKRDLRLTKAEVYDLAQFNARNHQGVLHTDETRKRMRELQERFDTFGYITTTYKRRSWWRRYTIQSYRVWRIAYRLGLTKAPW